MTADSNIKVEVHGNRPVGYLPGDSTSSPYTQKLEYIRAEPRVELKNDDQNQINDHRPPPPVWNLGRSRGTHIIPRSSPDHPVDVHISVIRMACR